MISLKPREKWTFSDYMYEIQYLAEISEVPGATNALHKIIAEIKEKYPEDAKECGL